MLKKPSSSRPVPLYVAIARMLIVSGMSIAMAVAILFFLAGVWQVGLLVLGLALVFLVLMFLVERLADRCGMLDLL
jgi:hypothetical protein